MKPATVFGLLGVAAVIFVCCVVIFANAASPSTSSATTTSLSIGTNGADLDQAPPGAKPDYPSDPTYYTNGSESLCAQGAQIAAALYNDTAAKETPENIPAQAYTIQVSHYVASTNSCYFEWHHILQLPNNLGIADNTELMVVGGPSQFEIESGNIAAPTHVVSCTTYSTGATNCAYYDPIEQNQTFGNPTWLASYNPTNAPPISLADFQSWLTRTLTAE